MPESALLGTLERKSGRIAFVGMDGNIYTMNQAGQDVASITEDAYFGNDATIRISYFYPTWALDGRRLAFIGYSQKLGQSPDASLYTARHDGSELTTIFSQTDKHPFYLYWLPSSEHVSFLSSTVRDSQFSLAMVPARGGAPLEIGVGIPFYWAWSPNSTALVAHTSGLSGHEPDQDKLSVVYINREVVHRRLTVLPSFFQSPVYSPDGNYFVTAIENGPATSSILLSDSSGETEMILADFQGKAAFDWSPDGDRLAYISGSPATFGMVGSLTLIELSDFAHPKTFETDASAVAAFFWSPSGRKLAYFEPYFAKDQEQGGQSLKFKLSVLDVTSGDILMLGSFRPPEVLLTQVFPHFDQYQRSATIWSPDGRYLVVNALKEDEIPGIFVVESSGNFEPRLISDGVMPFWSRN